MPKIGIKAELTRRVDAVIEIARLLARKGKNPDQIQEALINPLINEIDIRIKHGRGPKD